EICATPQLFADRAQEGQVKQGLLGDCWFLCACAALQKSQHLLDQVSATVRFLSDPCFLETLLLPVPEGGCVLASLTGEGLRQSGMKASPPERGIYGSYEHLWAGQVADALVDLTGGLAERWNLKDMAGTSGQQDRLRGAERRTCRQLLSLKDRCLLSCSVLSPRTGRAGAGGGTAGLRTWALSASCTELFTVVLYGLSGKQNLRNWCLSGEVSPFRLTRAYPYGETGACIGVSGNQVVAPSLAQALPGAWVKGQSAGGCRNNSGFPSNPKFWLRVCEPSEVYVAVLQRPQLRTAGHPGRDYQAVGLHLWKVEKRRVSLPRALSAPPVAGTACHAYDREVHLRCELPPGYYLAVPSTFLKDVPGQFLLRVFSSGRVSLSRFGPPTGRPPGLSPGLPQVPADGGGQDAPSLLLQEPLLSCVPHCYAQEVSRLCHLSQGTYWIVPSTYLPDAEGAFTVTVETRIDRRSIHSQEMLGQLLKEASFVAVMKA
ncbi:hypothetical protein E2I00_000339, partial [Balaenoptera physalus]